MSFQSTNTVREIALAIPGATRVFEQAGIDYCCGGQRSLTDACTKAGVSLAEMMQALQSADAASATAAEHFTTASLSELIQHIVRTHHAFTRTEIQRLNALLDKVYNVH